jgi:hypothetical protein
MGNRIPRPPEKHKKNQQKGNVGENGFAPPSAA